MSIEYGFNTSSSLAEPLLFTLIFCFPISFIIINTNALGHLYMLNFLLNNYLLLLWSCLYTFWVDCYALVLDGFPMAVCVLCVGLPFYFSWPTLMLGLFLSDYTLFFLNLLSMGNWLLIVMLLLTSWLLLFFH